MNVSYSKITTYLQCPYKHYLSYVKRLSPNIPVKALSFGSDMHKLLEVKQDKEKTKETFKKIKETYEDLSLKQQESLGIDYIENLYTIFKDYLRRYKNADNSFIPTQTEYRFELPIGTYRREKINFVGIIDELYLQKNNIRIGEHKTFSYRPSIDLLVMNQQICLYAKAVEIIYGKLVSEVLWDYIKSSPASEPIWLEKSSRFSTASSQNITPYSWERACKNRGINDKTIIAQGSMYEQNLNNFFFRINFEIIPDMVNKIWKDFQEVAKDVVKNGEKNKRQNVSKDCVYCSYRPICYAEFTNNDVDYIIEKDFYIKEKTKGDNNE